MSKTFVSAAPGHKAGQKPGVELVVSTPLASITKSVVCRGPEAAGHKHHF